jgi:hypothetical protein
LKNLKILKVIIQKSPQKILRLKKIKIKKKMKKAYAVIIKRNNK